MPDAGFRSREIDWGDVMLLIIPVCINDLNKINDTASTKISCKIAIDPGS
jgi:hypothetical protein